MDSENTWYDDDPGSTPATVPVTDSVAAADMAVPPCDHPEIGEHVDKMATTTESATPSGPDNGPDLPVPGRRAESAASANEVVQLAAVLDLFGRMKLIEDEDGGWNGGDTVDALSEWFAEFGIDVDDDVIAAAQELSMPSWLASFINSQTLDTNSLIIHLSSDNTSCTDLTRTHLTTLVRALGEGTTTTVYDNPGEQILRVNHADLDPVMF
ncbi:hypothetical protein C8D87_11495 [Lentzea atacamensis]|uniref:Uncharacterized protein n=1 Tax=Lentzea atacamensis TaxID=531938 RepID=A0ABX9DW10_9PSEU|nr:hypothetical protein [Lentzea atacamensis]RAS59483.1 hypothetical protein C8D87_11495 [Lentzea atacamensis]